MKVKFLDLRLQYLEIKKDIERPLSETFNRGDFILGKEEVIFEREFAKYCGSKFAVGVNSGTDALFLGLLSLGIGSGDEVIVPVFTYIASALAVTFTGARPVFADIKEDTYNIDVAKIQKLITKRTKAIMPVHLYGQCADMKPILDLAENHNIKIIEDAAQAHGAMYKAKGNQWRKAGTMGDLGCFSFYPTKNLGAFGDGGMIVTDNEQLFKKLLLLRDYGRISKYKHICVGYNSRLDTVQAAILRVKLRRLDEWNKLRRRNAEIYREGLKGVKGVILPVEADSSYHIYNVFAVRLKNRDGAMVELNKKGISAIIHYPIPLHLQKVYKNLGYKRGDFPIAEKVSREIVSLPMYPHLKESQIRFIVKAIKEA